MTRRLAPIGAPRTASRVRSIRRTDAPFASSEPRRARLQRSVDPRGFAVGTAPLRVGKLVYVIVLMLAFAGVVAGTMAISEVVGALWGSR
jgi:hypothetical protein